MSLFNFSQSVLSFKEKSNKIGLDCLCLFITAREKLDFAMREVIFDLLSVGKKNIVNTLPEVSRYSEHSTRGKWI